MISVNIEKASQNVSQAIYDGLLCFSLQQFPAWHGFFARTGGESSVPYASLNTAYMTDDPDSSLNRDRLFGALGIDKKPIRILNPCHGEQIVFTAEREWHDKARDVLIQTDAAFTRTPGSYFLVSTADCIPAIFTDFNHSFAGMAHLGWRGLVSRFTEKIVAALKDHYALHPDSIQVGIGPMIYPCCYRFKDPVQKNDPFWQPFLRDCEDGQTAIDLASAFRTQIIQSGIPHENILETGLCTGCRNAVFFSCYKEGYRSGRFPTVVGCVASV
jgi:YfiH family protein